MIGFHVHTTHDATHYLTRPRCLLTSPNFSQAHAHARHTHPLPLPKPNPL